MFFETIKLLNGRLYNPDLHLDRMNQTRKFYFPGAKKISLSELPSGISMHPDGLYKVRIDYDLSINNVSVDTYEIKTHGRLKIVDAGQFDYSYKAADRNFFAKTLSSFPEADDILFTKNGFLTDSTYCNIVLWDGQNWFTPTTFLLSGTKRKQLLKEGKILETEIHLNNLNNYQQIIFINAMRDFEKKYTFTRSGNDLILTPQNA